MSSDLDWGRLREYVKHDMVVAGYETQQDFVDALPSFSLRGLGDFLTGRSKPRAGTLAQFEVALGWAPGSAKDILRGGEPRRIAGEPSASSWPALGRGAAGDVVREAGMNDLLRMQAAVAEVFDEATGEEFLRRALQLRAQ